MEKVYFYRATDTVFCGGSVRVAYQRYEAIKETPCGYWIVPQGFAFAKKNLQRWISKVSRKRYAYPTKTEALESWKIRKLRQVEHAKYAFKKAEALYRLSLKDDVLSREDYIEGYRDSAEDF